MHVTKNLFGLMIGTFCAMDPAAAQQKKMTADSAEIIVRADQKNNFAKNQSWICIQMQDLIGPEPMPVCKELMVFRSVSGICVPCTRVVKRKEQVKPNEQDCVMDIWPNSYKGKITVCSSTPFLDAEQRLARDSTYKGIKKNRLFRL